MTRIDSHIHWNGDHQDWIDVLQDRDIKQINICVNHNGTDWRAGGAYTAELSKKRPDRFAWVTTFDLPRFDDREYVDQVISDLSADFEAGAIACKIWKNFGMEIKKPDGAWMMPDDPLLDPIYAYLSHEEIPLIAHIGEPRACWEPLDETSPHFLYYREHPEWHLYGKEDMPSHGEIVAARDRVLERYSDLRVVGAHLGSLEFDVAEVARRLDEYPNFAVDTSARQRDLELQDDADVAQFITKYQDRILWGTDLVGRDALSQMSVVQRRNAIDEAETRFTTEFGYYEQQLGLPNDILEQLFYHNALRWFPRLPAGW